MKRIKG